MEQSTYAWGYNGDTIITSESCMGTVFTSEYCMGAVFTSEYCMGAVFTSEYCMGAVFTSEYCMYGIQYSLVNIVWDTIFTSKYCMGYSIHWWLWGYTIPWGDTLFTSE